MTANPISVTELGSGNDALNIMVKHKYRHLPVIHSDKIANLDLTKLVYAALSK